MVVEPPLPPDAVATALAAPDGISRLRLSDGRDVVCKRRRGAAAEFFASESRGLVALADCGGLRVPEVVALGREFLLLEDLGEGHPDARYAHDAGTGLAEQHWRQAERFGFVADGFCGDSPQDNTRDTDGHRFFAERRLLPQARRALAAGHLVPRDLARVESICTRLPALVPVQPPVLLHGDLWTGNLHCTGDGHPALLDAGAVHHGWAEADLAMLLLFGAPPAALFDAYAGHSPLDRDWRERAPLYNLYHLLNHLTLFDGGYAASVRRVLDRFA